MSRPAHERVLDRCVAADGGCIVFTGALDPNGYGRAGTGGKVGTGLAHRIVWEGLVGPIPSGLVLDHVAEKCRYHNCVNHHHLEPVTQAVNAHRGGPLGQSGIRNVVATPDGRFRGMIKVAGKSYHCGTFDTMQEAKTAAEARRAELTGGPS